MLSVKFDLFLLFSIKDENINYISSMLYSILFWAVLSSRENSLMKLFVANCEFTVPQLFPVVFKVDMTQDMVGFLV